MIAITRKLNELILQMTTQNLYDKIHGAFAMKEYPGLGSL